MEKQKNRFDTLLKAMAEGERHKVEGVAQRKLAEPNLEAETPSPPEQSSLKD